MRTWARAAMRKPALIPAACRGFQLFSPTVMSSFMTAFGAFGLIFSKISATESPWLSAPWLWPAAALFPGRLHDLQHDVQEDPKAPVNPASRRLWATRLPSSRRFPRTAGEIAYVQGGSRYTAPPAPKRKRCIRREVREDHPHRRHAILRRSNELETSQPSTTNYQLKHEPHSFSLRLVTCRG